MPAWTRLTAALAALGLVLAGCNDGDDDPGTTEDPVQPLIQLRIESQDFRFVPANVEVPLDASISLTFENTGEVRHSLVIPESEVDAEIDPATSTAVAFRAPSEAGVYQFFCKFHSEEMQGELFVGDGEGPPQGSSPAPTVENTGGSPDAEGDTVDDGDEG